MNLREVSRAIRRADIASLTLTEACRALADLPAARQYDVSPALIWRATHNALPPEQADRLIEQAGIRERIRLADLAYLAQHDEVLLKIVATLIELCDRGGF